MILQTPRLLLSWRSAIDLNTVHKSRRSGYHLGDDYPRPDHYGKEITRGVINHQACRDTDVFVLALPLRKHGFGRYAYLVLKRYPMICSIPDFRYAALSEEIVVEVVNAREQEGRTGVLYLDFSRDTDVLARAQFRAKSEPVAWVSNVSEPSIHVTKSATRLSEKEGAAWFADMCPACHRPFCEHRTIIIGRQGELVPPGDDVPANAKRAMPTNDRLVLVHGGGSLLFGREMEALQAIYGQSWDLARQVEAVMSALVPERHLETDAWAELRSACAAQNWMLAWSELVLRTNTLRDEGGLEVFVQYICKSAAACGQLTPCLSIRDIVLQAVDNVVWTGGASESIETWINEAWKNHSPVQPLLFAPGQADVQDNRSTQDERIAQALNLLQAAGVLPAGAYALPASRPDELEVVDHSLEIPSSASGTLTVGRVVLHHDNLVRAFQRGGVSPADVREAFGELDDEVELGTRERVQRESAFGMTPEQMGEVILQQARDRGSWGSGRTDAEEMIETLERARGCASPGALGGLAERAEIARRDFIRAIQDTNDRHSSVPTFALGEFWVPPRLLATEPPSAEDLAAPVLHGLARSVGTSMHGMRQTTLEATCHGGIPQSHAGSVTSAGMAWIKVLDCADFYGTIETLTYANYVYVVTMIVHSIHPVGTVP